MLDDAVIGHTVCWMIDFAVVPVPINRQAVGFSAGTSSSSPVFQVGGPQEAVGAGWNVDKVSGALLLAVLTAAHAD